MEKILNNQLRIEYGKAKKFRRTLMVFFLLITIAPILINGFFSYQNFRKTLNRKIAQYTLEGLSQTVVNIQLKLAEFENISLRLFVNKDFSHKLGNYVSGLSQKSDVEDYFNEYMISNKDIFSFMFICNTSSAKSIIITKDYYKDFSNLVKYFQNTSSYRKIVGAGGGIVWSNTIKLNRNYFVILGRSINDLDTGRPLGILAIAVDEDKIDQLANLTIYNRLNISFDQLGNHSLIVNNDGEIISSPFKEEIGRNISKMIKETQLLRSILNPSVSDRDYGSEINQGCFIAHVNQQPTLVTYKAIGSKIGVGGRSGWNLINLTSTSYLSEEKNTQIIHTFISCIIFGIIAVASAFYITHLAFTL